MASDSCDQGTIVSTGKGVALESFIIGNPITGSCLVGPVAFILARIRVVGAERHVQLAAAELLYFTITIFLQIMSHTTKTAHRAWLMFPWWCRWGRGRLFD